MARREVTPFNLSFLDVMFCGFGAVVLLVVLIYGRVVEEQVRTHQDLRSEVLAKQRELSVQQERMELRQAALESTEDRLDTAQDEVTQASRRIADLEAQLAGGPDPAAGEKRIADLEAELERLEARVEELREEAQEGSGRQLARVEGEGRRQYLSGLKLGGERILVLLDASASMLDASIVNIIRLRNMPPDRRRNAEKWQQVVRSARWLLANLPRESQFQVYLFNTEAKPILDGTAGQWLRADDSGQIQAILDRLETEVAPEDGTSLFNAFAAVRELSPRPDNILLLTDGLPTQGSGRPNRSTISGEDRLRLFERAMVELGTAIPVNTLLFPMEGDPVAAAAYWLLATRTRGSFITPSKDWP